MNGGGGGLLPIPPLIDCILRYAESSEFGVVETVAGSISRKDANALHSPAAICTESLIKPYTSGISPFSEGGGFFVADFSSVRYIDHLMRVSLVAGSPEQAGYRDGHATKKAQFHTIQGLIASRDGTRLIVADSLNHRIRMIDLTTRHVSTVAGDGTPESRDGVATEDGRIGCPRKLVFYRTGTGNSHSDKKTAADGGDDQIVFITTSEGIRRLDLTANKLTTLKLQTMVKLSPFGIDCLLSSDTGGGAHLVIGCVVTHSIFVIDPRTGDVQWLASKGKGSANRGATPKTVSFSTPCDIVVCESISSGGGSGSGDEHELFVVDRGNDRIRRITYAWQDNRNPNRVSFE